MKEEINILNGKIQEIKKVLLGSRIVGGGRSGNGIEQDNLSNVRVRS